MDRNQLRPTKKRKPNKKDNSFRRFIEKYAGSIPGNIDYDEAKDEYLRKKYGI